VSYELGPFGVIKELILNSKIKNRTLKESIRDTRKVEKMFYDSLQTETAKKKSSENQTCK
jgi:hypothetical protein